MSLANKTTTGILWNFTEQLSTRGIGIAVSLLLARFLVPADYGLVAMMAVFIAVAGNLRYFSNVQIFLLQSKDITEEV